MIQRNEVWETEFFVDLVHLKGHSTPIIFSSTVTEKRIKLALYSKLWKSKLW